MHPVIRAILQSGAVTFDGNIYNRGTKYVDMTKYTETGASITEAASSVQFRETAGTTINLLYGTTDKIDLTNYTTLRMTAKCNATAAGMVLAVRSTPTGANVSNVVFSSTTESDVTLDVTALNGDYYIVAYESGTAASYNFDADIYVLRLE